jgi:hypothetical protein
MVLLSCHASENPNPKSPNRSTMHPQFLVKTPKSWKSEIIGQANFKSKQVMSFRKTINGNRLQSINVKTLGHY